MRSNSNPRASARTNTAADPAQTSTASVDQPAKATSVTPKHTTPEKTPAKAKRAPGKTQTAKTPRPRPRATNPSGSSATAKDRPAEKAAQKPVSTSRSATAAARLPREGSTLWAILHVLNTATEPLTAKEIYAQIIERNLATGLKGKTPEQTIAAKLAVAAKRGQHVERTAPGRFRLLASERRS